MALLTTFLFILAQMFWPPINELVRGPFFLLPFLIFFSLGLWLLLTVRKQKLNPWTKKYLLLTGVGATGIFVCILLHNFFYALAIISQNILALKFIFEILHAGFFLIGVIACPLGFIIGVIFSLSKINKVK